MKLLLLVLTASIIYGCSTTDTNTLPFNRPDDIRIEFTDLLNQKSYYISKDSSYAVFTLDGVDKRIDMEFTDEALDKLYNAFTNNTFDRIDTLNLPMENLSEDAKKPFQVIKLSWGEKPNEKSLEKSKSAVIGIKPFWEDKFTAVMSAIVMASQDMMDKSKKDFPVIIDPSLQNESNFITIDLNTFNSIDPLDTIFYYNSNENGVKDTLEYRLVEGLNRMGVFYNRKNPAPGEGFMIANNTFEFNLADTMSGLKLTLEGDSIKWRLLGSGN